MADYERHPGVDAYLGELPDWQRDIGTRLRDLIHAAEPKIEETIKRRVQLRTMLRQIVANNRAGGWRKLKKTLR